MKPLRALIGLSLVALSFATAAPRATASSPAELRARAQSVADGITRLEKRLDRLRKRKESLQRESNDLTREIGGLEGQIHDHDLALEDALSSYVERAVEAYKGGFSGGRLEMLLSTSDVTELMTIAEAASVASEIDGKRLEELDAARSAAEELQERLDRRKGRLVEAQAEADEVVDEIASTLDERRARLADLMKEVKKLEAEARRAAEAAATPQVTLASALGAPVQASSDIPAGYVSTGVTFGGVASWYGPGFAGNSTANGEIFDPMAMTAASKELPFNTLLFVEFQGRGVVVRINDRGPYVGDRIIDLSQGAAQAIGLSGIGWIDATIVLKG